MSQNRKILSRWKKIDNNRCKERQMLMREKKKE